jgi:hypothetical protein
MMFAISVWLILLISFQFSFSQCVKPSSVKVLPVFFVPTDANPPSDAQKADLVRHLKWSQSRYRELLGNRSMFGIADTVPLVYKSNQNTAFYVQNGAADNFAGELMAYLGYNRYTCPYIFLTVFMSDNTDFPTGGARPFNGGYNTGGGVVQLSSYALSKMPSFQCTLQHELGHSFGLPHVDVYGYSMDTNMSFMSYNPKHHTNGFNPSATPGIMIPEDVRGLALNDLAFPNLEFDLQKDIPSGYSIAGIVILGIEEIPGQPYISASTTAGSQYGTNISNTLFQVPTATQDGNILRVDLNWLSDALPDGWAEIIYDFPMAVFLDGVYLHQAFGGDGVYHDADSIEVFGDTSGVYKRLTSQNIDAVDNYVSFDKIRTKKLKVRLRARNATSVCLRGMGFFYKGDDLFPPYVPYISRDPDAKLIPGPTRSLLPAHHAQIFNQTKVDFAWQRSSAAKKYRLQIDTTEWFCFPMEMETPDTACVLNLVSTPATYFWRVRGLNDFKYGSGEWSEIRTFMTKYVVAAKEKMRRGCNRLSLGCFPDRIVWTIDANEQLPASLRLYNLQGRLMATLFDGILEGARGHTWKFPLRMHGMYVARLSMGTDHEEIKFVIE